MDGRFPRRTLVRSYLGLARYWNELYSRLHLAAIIPQLVDVYLMYAASALAANTIFRSAVGAAFPLFTRQMFTGMAIQWAALLVGFVAIILTPAPFIFYFYGSKIRKLSKFAPALDLSIRDKLEKEGKSPLNSMDSWKVEGKSGLPLAKKEFQEKQENEKQGGRNIENA